MKKEELILILQSQLEEKKIELTSKIQELENEYNIQTYINDLLLIARKDIHLLAEYISKLQDPELFLFKALVSNFIRSEEDFNNILVESKNLYIMKKHNFDILGVPQYTKSKIAIENLVRRLNQYNLVRDFKYININYIEELKEYLKRVEETLKYFDNGKLISQIKDIKEIEYIIEKSNLDEETKTAIVYVILDINNNFYKEEGEEYATETILINKNSSI